MKIVYNWLKEYLPFDLPVKELSSVLTHLGLEVGSVERVEQVKGGLSGVVVGKVIACEPHPHSEHLHLTTVDVGGKEPLPIVCGAPNVATGQKVPVAMEGTILYSGEKAIKIKKTKIRGEFSCGMICAEDELGLGKDHEGIMVLAEDALTGQPLKEHLNLKDDYVFEIDLTPNRIDAASHIGVARDLAAYLQQTSKSLSVKLPSVESFQPSRTPSPLKVEVKAPEGVIRYAGLTIQGIKVKESPDWLKRKLHLLGLKPINNIVDCTNFILFELGQPLHAFDLQYISGNRIQVQTLPAGTKFTTLFEEEISLTEADLMICNNHEGMCLAGVLGGLKSGVTDETQSIFLESACFHPIWIRKTAKRHQIHTDSSFRFERSTDPNICLYALKRAALLIQEVAGGEISQDMVDIYPQEIAPFPVDLNLSYMSSFIGQEIPPNRVEQILTALEIQIIAKEGDTWHLKVPTYRVDVQRQNDVIEEVLRVYGYNNIVIPQKLNGTLASPKKPNEEILRNRLSTYLSAVGFHEIVCNSLTTAIFFENIGYPSESLVKLLNPLSSDLDALRPSLLLGGLQAVALNTSHKNRDLLFYEFGTTYSKAYQTISKNPLEKYKERQKAALWLSGKIGKSNWAGQARKATFFSLKSYSLQLLEKLAIEENELLEEPIANEHPIFLEGLLWKVRSSGQTIGVIGQVKPSLLANMKIKQPLFYGEMEWDTLMHCVAAKTIKYKPLIKTPAVQRDLSLWIKEGISFAQLKAVAFETERKLLKEVTLFDVYEEKQEDGKLKRSYALNFLLHHPEKTLQDRQIDGTMSRIIQAYEKIGAHLKQ